MISLEISRYAQQVVSPDSFHSPVNSALCTLIEIVTIFDERKRTIYKSYKKPEFVNEFGKSSNNLNLLNKYK